RPQRPNARRLGPLRQADGGGRDRCAGAERLRGADGGGSHAGAGGGRPDRPGAGRGAGGEGAGGGETESVLHGAGEPGPAAGRGDSSNREVALPAWTRRAGIDHDSRSRSAPGVPPLPLTIQGSRPTACTGYRLLSSDDPLDRLAVLIDEHDQIAPPTTDVIP